MSFALSKATAPPYPPHGVALLFLFPGRRVPCGQIKGSIGFALLPTGRNYRPVIDLRLNLLHYNQRSQAAKPWMERGPP
jgi:hypothetical protein